MMSRKERKKAQQRKREELLSRTTPPLTIEDIDAMTPTFQYTPKRESLGHRVNKFYAEAMANFGARADRRKAIRRAAKQKAHAERHGITVAELASRIKQRREARNA